jgi:uroporphyrinogen decarboxylase
MSCDNGDDLLHMEQGFNIHYEEWVQQGLPSSVANNPDWLSLDHGENLYDHFNVAGYLYCRFDQFCIPPFEERILAVEDGRKIYVNPKGATVKAMVDGHHGGLYHEMDFAIKGPGDYQENRHRFIGSTDKRYDDEWLRHHGPEIRAQDDHPVALWVHGPFAFLREFLGVQNSMILPYTEPEMIKLMLADHLETCMASSAPVIEACRPDMCFVWEDCCGSSGPFIAPDVFASIMAPWYREWKKYLVSMHVPWIMLDTDGNPSSLVRLWYESGVDCMQPWEVNSVDMLQFAEEFPDYVMMGGIYKHMFEPDHPSQVGRFDTKDMYEAINQELERVVGFMRRRSGGRGGYIAALDHWAFPGTTYRGYRYYSDQLAEKHGKANHVTRLARCAAGRIAEE